MSLLQRRAGPSFFLNQYYNKYIPDEQGFFNSRKSMKGHPDMIVAKHQVEKYWWRSSNWSVKPFGVRHYNFTPRTLLSRDMYGPEEYDMTKRVPDETRWEKISNGQRVTEDRWALVEEDGEMHKVNWKLYSQRVESELQAAYDGVPQFRYRMNGMPTRWEKMDGPGALTRGGSVREGLAQCKLSERKHNYLVGRSIEMAQQQAEGKGLDKEKLRISYLEPFRGKTEKGFHIMSKGFYAYLSLKSTNLRMTLVEDPEMVLPDRMALPFKAQLSLRKAGLATEPLHESIDVPAITAEGI